MMQSHIAAVMPSQWSSLLTSHLPTAVSAAVLLAGGWLLAMLLSILIQRALVRVDAAFGRHATWNDSATAKWLRSPPSKLVGRVTFWIIFLFFFSACAEVLGLRVVSSWISGLAIYLPRVLAAVVILCVGFVVGGFVRDAVSQTVRAAGSQLANVIGRTIQIGIIGVTLVIAAEQMGVDITFLAVITAVVAGSLLVGAALAFALGARTTVSNILAAHYIQRSCAVGDCVTIDGYRGRIIAITTTNVVLDAHERRIVIPAKLFSETVCVIEIHDEQANVE